VRGQAGPGPNPALWDAYGWKIFGDLALPQPPPMRLQRTGGGGCSLGLVTQGGTAFALGYKYFAPMELSVCAARRRVGNRATGPTLHVGGRADRILQLLNNFRERAHMGLTVLWSNGGHG
jgi:hypothetical protein